MALGNKQISWLAYSNFLNQRAVVLVLWLGMEGVL